MGIIKYALINKFTRVVLPQSGVLTQCIHRYKQTRLQAITANCLTILPLRGCIPVVHLESVQPGVQTQLLGAVQLPPFGQDVDPEQRAEM